MKDGSARPAAPTPWPAWHIIGPWALAVAQPVFEVLRDNGDFFVAHRASPTDLGLFTASVTLFIPAVLVAAVALLGRVLPRAGRAAHLGVLALIAAALASQLLVRMGSSPIWIHLALVLSVGGLFSLLYERLAGLRWCCGVLVLAAPAFALLFLLHPSMEPFVRPNDPTAAVHARVPDNAPPIVVVVFDQLPLSSLLGRDGTVDGARYPGFAELAAGSTWYRNATSNAELTGWALPAILSGRLPRPKRLPIAQYHPHNLFTLLGDGYHLEITEPITRLCPARLCPQDQEPLASRVASMLLDAGIVYAHIVSPDQVRQRLPALTADWRDFVKAEHWQGRWVRARDRDRTEPVARFLHSIDDEDPKPTLYFLHVLLPHEPYQYMRTGQRFTDETDITGLQRGERWTDDEWVVTLAYQRHLAQVEYVDNVVTRLLAQLRSERLYDDAVVVVTADHGVSFRPGRPWKALTPDTQADVIGVPLFVKAPRQREGRVDARNMQAIDILPTIAALVGIEVPSEVEGRPASVPESYSVKTIMYSGANRELTVDTAEHARHMLTAVARRWTLFGEDGRPVPAGAPRALLDDRVPTTAATVPSSTHVLLEEPQRFLDVDLGAPLLPLDVSGRVQDTRGRALDATLAVSVNGTIEALTRTGRNGDWSALLRRSALRAGRNIVQVFVVDDEGRDLQLAYTSGTRPETVNLASNAADDFWGVELSGFHPGDRGRSTGRWTNGDGTVVVPLGEGAHPRSLRVALAGPPEAGGPVRITVNDCVLHDASIDARPWSRTFSLDACAPMRSAREATIRIHSAVTAAQDGRPRGVSVESVHLFSLPWPPPPAGEDALTATVDIAGPAHPVAHREPLRVTLRNSGGAVWGRVLGNAQVPTVALELRWRSAAGVLDRSQRLSLPGVAFPGDRVDFDVPLVPPSSVDGTGPWELSLVPVTIDEGRDVAVEKRATITVAP